MFKVQKCKRKSLKVYLKNLTCQEVFVSPTEWHGSSVVASVRQSPLPADSVLTCDQAFFSFSFWERGERERKRNA